MKIMLLDDRPEDLLIEALNLGYNPTHEQCKQIVATVGDTYIGNSTLLIEELEKLGLRPGAVENQVVFGTVHRPKKRHSTVA